MCVYVCACVCVCVWSYIRNTLGRIYVTENTQDEKASHIMPIHNYLDTLYIAQMVELVGSISALCALVFV